MANKYFLKNIIFTKKINYYYYKLLISVSIKKKNKDLEFKNLLRNILWH